MDISRFNYFSYQDRLDPILSPITSRANIKLLTFRRCYPNREQFLISGNDHFQKVYYPQELYRHGYFEKEIKSFESAFHLWDHLPPDYPRYIYNYMQNHHHIAHGLTITQQHEDYCDFFVFASEPGNTEINNFYINRKELFSEFIKAFYQNLHPVIEYLSHHRFILPSSSIKMTSKFAPLTPRQRECGVLMIEGLTTKEIAKSLNISHRTVEEYINTLKSKFEAKTRSQLSYELRQYI
ncbi:MAG: helix-turn-helix transcriptional regulator [Alphaproteobacteria bacterium]|jgi:DNA-binding CsgD family transcriptional regulator|nr:helix-turn-helix transcriptional regulator [Alphaproteobacteria bacterium]